MPSISRKWTFPDHSASLYNPVGGIDHVPNLFRGNCILCQSLLPTYICTSRPKTKHHYLGCATSPSHYYTDRNRHTSGSHSRKVYHHPEFADNRTGRYNPSIWAGFALWTLGLGLQTTFGPDISLGKIVGYLIVEGFGIGLTFQTSILRLPGS